MKRVYAGIIKTILSGIFMFCAFSKVSSQCITSFPYLEGFETAASWTIAGTNPDWAWGTPAHPTINSAGGGSRSWCVGGLNGSFYNNGEQASIVSPCFNFTTLSYPWISFKIFWECEFNYDGMVLQYSTNNGTTWSNVGAFGDPNDCNTANWFNHNNISKLTSITTRHGWSGRIGPTASGCTGGNGSGGWVTAKHCLTGLANQPNVRFRFLFGAGTTCNGFDGIAIDDIFIGNGTSHVANYTFTCSGNNSLSFTAVTAPCPSTVNYTWNFGDPSSGPANTSTLQNPTHIFSSPGNYSVTLISSGGQCNPPDTIVKIVSIGSVSNPVAQNVTCFGFSNGTASVAVTGGGPYTYTWLPSGGNSSNASGLSAGFYTVNVNDANNCTYTRTVSITEPSALTGNVSVNDPGCGQTTGSATIAVNGGTAPYSYQWLPSGGNLSTEQNLVPGNYTVGAVDANNCVITKTLSVVQLPALQLSVNSLTLCPNQNGNLVANVSGGTAPYSYNWNGTLTAVNSIQVSSASGTVIPVKVTDNNGCISNVDSAKVYYPSPFNIAVSPPDTICSGSSTTLFANASGGNGIYTYNWQPGGYSTPAITISPQSAQQITVTVSDGCNSVQSGIIPVSIYTLSPLPFTASQTSGCSPLCVDFSVPDQSLNGYGWNFGDSTENVSGANPNHCFEKSGTFDIKLNYITKEGCVAETVMNNYINVFPSPTADFDASTYETDVYNPTVEFYSNCTGAQVYNWYFGGNGYSYIQNPSHTFTAEGHFHVLLAVANSFGCIDTVSKDIYIRPDFTFYAPNAFTPNEDGLNDRFIPVGSGWNPEKYQLAVFDRWGEQIFLSKRYDEGWDGKVKHKGEIAPAGVYIWKALITDVFNNHHEFHGHVMLNK